MSKPISISYNGREKCKMCRLTEPIVRLEVDTHIVLVCYNCLSEGLKEVAAYPKYVAEVATVRNS